MIPNQFHNKQQTVTIRFNHNTSTNLKRHTSPLKPSRNYLLFILLSFPIQDCEHGLEDQQNQPSTEPIVVSILFKENHKMNRYNSMKKKEYTG